MLVARGSSNARITGDLGIIHGTAKVHAARILAELGRRAGYRRPSTPTATPVRRGGQLGTPPVRGP
ncbi:hypothetical protein [Nocardiopsis codii]|uniref:hypothetical protein n=1 Tax=Nocardiopsis codii TaxID=3065942 RepID=UPI002E7C412A|nr:hypothetical protein [Nocardiopsis sp. CT-R113]